MKQNLKNFIVDCVFMILFIVNMILDKGFLTEIVLLVGFLTFNFIINFKFIKNSSRKFYTFIFNIIFPLFIVFIIGYIILDVLNFDLPYILNNEYKYEIEFSPRSMIEGSSTYTYKINLKEKTVIGICKTYWINKLTDKKFYKKKLTDSETNYLQSLLNKVFDSDTYQSYNPRKSMPTLDDMMIEYYYFSNKYYKDKRVPAYDSLIQKLVPILEQ